MVSRLFIAPPLIAASVALSTILLPTLASAQQVHVEQDRMNRSMEDYFEGERAAGYVFFGQGLVSMGTSAFLFTRQNDMSRGAAYPVVVVGALEATVGLALMIRTSKQIAERRKQIAAEPAKFRQDEQKRMKRVIGQFVFLEIVEVASVVTGIGLVTGGELTKKPFLTGIGAGLAVQGAALLGLDFLAERRGQRYLKSIIDFQPMVARDGFGMAVRGVF